MYIFKRNTNSGPHPDLMNFKRCDQQSVWTSPPGDADTQCNLRTSEQSNVPKPLSTTLSLTENSGLVSWIHSTEHAHVFWLVFFLPPPELACPRYICISICSYLRKSAKSRLYPVMSWARVQHYPGWGVIQCCNTSKGMRLQIKLTV